MRNIFNNWSIKSNCCKRNINIKVDLEKIYEIDDLEDLKNYLFENVKLNIKDDSVKNKVMSIEKKSSKINEI